MNCIRFSILAESDCLTIIFILCNPFSRSMCFLVQWQLHVSRAFLRQDGSCVHMPPLASASDAALLRSIIVGPAPSAVELRATPHATHGTPCVHAFQTSEANEWLVADDGSDKALKVPRALIAMCTVSVQ